jgi:hypothetical protein
LSRRALSASVKTRGDEAEVPAPFADTVALMLRRPSNNDKKSVTRRLKNFFMNFPFYCGSLFHALSRRIIGNIIKGVDRKNKPTFTTKFTFLQKIYTNI